MTRICCFILFLFFELLFGLFDFAWWLRDAPGDAWRFVLRNWRMAGEGLDGEAK